MNFSNNAFPFFKDSGIGLSEYFRMPCSSIGKYSFCKFYKLFANWLLIFKKRTNFIDNVGQSSACNSPVQLIPMIGITCIPVYEVDCSAESLEQPFKNRVLGIIALKHYFIHRIWFVFCFRFNNSERTFSIYKSSQISKIFLGWFNCISRCFKFALLIFRDQICVMFYRFHFFYKTNSFFDAARFGEFYKNSRFFRFFHQIINNAFGKINTVLLLVIKMINRFMCGIYNFRGRYSSLKKLFKPQQNLFIGRNNIQMAYEFTKAFANVKTPISIYVTSCVSKIGIFYHASNIA